MNKKKKMGIGLIVAGIFIVFIMLGADKIGLGDGDHGFGPKQKVGTLAGCLVIAGGVVMARMRDS